MTTKKCKGCGEKKEVSSFYAHPGMKDGYLNHCKACKKKTILKINHCCFVCKKIFLTTASEIKRGCTTCSRDCFYKRLTSLIAEKNKGMKMTYTGVHAWIKRTKGMPRYCEICKSSTMRTYDWSNVSGEYKRDLSDWQRLCRQCHIKYDRMPEKRKNTLMYKYGSLNTRNIQQ